MARSAAGGTPLEERRGASTLEHVAIHDGPPALRVEDVEPVLLSLSAPGVSGGDTLPLPATLSALLQPREHGGRSLTPSFGPLPELLSLTHTAGLAVTTDLAR